VSEIVADIFDLGASSIDPEAGTTKWQALTDANNPKAENLGEVEVFQSLGMTARPYPADANGAAEGVGLRNCGGRSLVCIAARDARTAKVAAGLKPGDVCLHSTGPKQSSQIRCLEEKRQVVAATKDSSDNAIMVVLDGKNDKLQVTARGAMFEMDKSGDISIVNASGTGILIQGSKIFILGELSLPGMTPSMYLMQGPVAGSPGGGAAAPMTAVKGVSK
jgi:hypothetical protein